MANIYNPEAYYRAKDSNIKMNASKGRLKKWLAAGEDHQELYNWLDGSGEYADVEIVREILASKWDDGNEYGSSSEDWPINKEIDLGQNHSEWNGEEYVDTWEPAIRWVIEKNGTRYVCLHEKARHPAREKMFDGNFGSFLVKLAQSLIGNHYKQTHTEWWGSLSEKQTEVVRKALARAKENVDKREERKAEWAAESAKREYVGEVGDKHFEVKGTISFITSWEGTYGITYLTLIRDADDNSIKYKGKFLGDKGDTVEMIATIKAHEVYNDEKQTIVNRPRKIEIGEAS